MFASPATTPVTTPVADPTVATAGLLLLHVPPLGVHDSAVVALSHTAAVPVIAAGAAFTVITFVW